MMRKTLRTSVLVLALSTPAFAGDIPMPPVPQPSITAEEQATSGEVRPGAADSFTEILLSALESTLEIVFALS
ncbi:MAG TPA: hypothetical protein VF668_11880 [Pyrinomonadaceae bacterium]